MPVLVYRRLERSETAVERLEDRLQR
jgi:hypothetical protein